MTAKREVNHDERQLTRVHWQVPHKELSSLLSLLCGAALHATTTINDQPDFLGYGPTLALLRQPACVSVQNKLKGS